MSNWKKIDVEKMPETGECVFLRDEHTMTPSTPEGDYPSPVRFEADMGGIWVDWFYGTEIFLDEWTHWILPNS